MRREEEQVLPLAAEALLPEDWEAIDAAFASNDDPVVGASAGKAFRELFRHLVAILPPPYGVGPAAGGAATELGGAPRVAAAGLGPLRSDNRLVRAPSSGRPQACHSRGANRTPASRPLE